MPIGPKGEHFSYSKKGKAAHARAVKKAGKSVRVKAGTKKKTVKRGKEKRSSSSTTKDWNVKAAQKAFLKGAFTPGSLDKKLGK